MNSRQDTTGAKLPLEELQRLDATCLRFEESWRNGAVPRLEDFLKGLDGAQRSWLLRELLRLELDYRVRCGEMPSLDDYRRRLPRDVTVVESVFASSTFDEHAGELEETCGQSTVSMGSDTELLHHTKPSAAFGDYELLEKVGEGGMGVVYRALQKSAGRIVAVKIIHPDRMRGASGRKRELFERFRLEARAAARLEHPNIARVYDVGQIEGRLYYSMEYVAGQSLHEMLIGGPLDNRVAAVLLESVARAVHDAHLHQIIHRDLNPRNIVLRNGRQRLNDDGDERHTRTAGSTDTQTSNLDPRITDFGLARLLDESPDLTQSGEVLGTPAYMSPEQALGRAVDQTTDVYSLGATLYEVLVGRAPFKAATIAETHRQVIETEPVVPRRLNPSVDPDLETVCLKCLEKESAARYHSAGELADDLRRFLDGRPLLARPRTGLARCWRWCYRRPGWAALWATTIVLLLVLSIGGPLTAWHQSTLRERADSALRRADVALAAETSAREAAVEAQSEAETAKRNAEKQLVRAEWLLYASRIAAVRRAWEAGDAAAAREELSSTSARFRDWEYDYWRSHFTRRYRALSGHMGHVTAVDFSRDGHWLMTADRNRLVRVWNVAAGRTARSFRTSSPVYAAAFNPAGDRIVVAGHDGSVSVWGQQGGRPIWTSDDHRGRVFSVSFTSDGRKVLSAGDDGIARIWDATDGKVLQRFGAEGLAIRSADFLPSDDAVITAVGIGHSGVAGDKPPPAPDGIVWWDAVTGQVLRRIARPVALQANLAVSPDGRSIALVSGNSIEMRRADNGDHLRHWTLTQPVTSLVWDAESRYIVAGCGDGLIRVLDVTNGRLELALKADTGPVLAVALSPDGRSIASGGPDHRGRLWSIASSRQSWTLSANGPVQSIACSRDGRYAAAATMRSGPGARVRVWDLARRELLLDTVRNDANPAGVAFHPQRAEVYVAWRDDFISVFQLADGSSRTPFKSGVAHRPNFRCLAISPDGRMLVGGDEDGQVKLFDTVAGHEMRRLANGGASVWSVLFTTDGRRVVSGSKDGRIRIYELSSSLSEDEREAHAAGVTCLAISADSRWLASGGDDRLVKLWEVEQGHEARVLRGHQGAILGLAFTPNGGRLASLAADGTVRLWDTGTGHQTMVLGLANARSGGLVFSPDGRRLIAGTTAGQVHIWELDGAPPQRPDASRIVPAERSVSSTVE